MKFLKLPKLKKSAKAFDRFDREMILVWGFVFILLFTVLLVAWDGYLFYRTVIEDEMGEMVFKKIVVIDPAEMDEVINLLDERQRKFEEILGGR